MGTYQKRAGWEISKSEKIALQKKKKIIYSKNINYELFINLENM